MPVGHQMKLRFISWEKNALISGSIIFSKHKGNGHRVGNHS
uniref:Uncharacterized protein n=1 Tax=Rhizophora mucronata TaxID=61149 RepID=A0A2P2N819_RHIMU